MTVLCGTGSAMRSDFNLAGGNAQSRAQERAAAMAAFLKFVSEAVDMSSEEPAAKVPIEGTKRAKTKFQRRQVTRIVDGIKASKVTGTFEFLLDDDLVQRFRGSNHIRRPLASL